MKKISILLAAAASLIAVPGLAQQKAPPAFTWIVAENGLLPPGALPAGTENNQPTAACRILLQGALYAGRVSNGACRVGVAGREAFDRRYEVLVAAPNALVWLHSAQIDRLPPGAIAGGYEPGPRVNILCRTQLPIGMVPGRYAGKGCIVSNANAEVTTSSFEVAALAQASRPTTMRGLAAGSESDTFAKDAQAATTAMEVELAGAGVRPDDPLFVQLQRLDAALSDVAQKATQQAAPQPGPAARAASPFELAVQQAQTSLDQLASAAAPRASGFFAALVDAQKKSLATLVQSLQKSGAAQPIGPKQP